MRKFDQFDVMVCVCVMCVLQHKNSHAACLKHQCDKVDQNATEGQQTAVRSAPGVKIRETKLQDMAGNGMQGGSAVSFSGGSSEHSTQEPVGVTSALTKYSSTKKAYAFVKVKRIKRMSDHRDAIKNETVAIVA